MRRSRAGITYLEILAATLIAFACIAGLFSLWPFSHSLSTRSQHEGAAYNLARRAMEQIRQTGFADTAEIPAGSPQVQYYNTEFATRQAQDADAIYSLSTTVVTDALVPNSSPPQPELTALRTVTVTVRLRATDETLCVMTTYLARSGI